MLRTNNLGPDNRKTANAAKSLGMVYFLLNKTDEAQFLLQEYCRIFEGKSDRSDLEHVAALIMLSDIQIVNNRHKLASKILYTARELCNKCETIGEIQAQQLSELRQMVDLRRLDQAPSLCARMDEDQQDVPEVTLLEHDPKELRTFQSLLLTDD